MLVMFIERKKENICWSDYGFFLWYKYFLFVNVDCSGVLGILWVVVNGIFCFNIDCLFVVKIFFKDIGYFRVL